MSEQSRIPNGFFELYDAESYEEFIKVTERTLFRKAPEYKLWLATTNNDKCALTGEDKNSVEIEVHHYGTTLWDITVEVVDAIIEEGLLVNSFYVCQILADLHLSGCVDYIPLAHDVHKMYHKNYGQFCRKYPDAESFVTHGDMKLKKEIIHDWVARLKRIQQPGG